jgi:hypothetical protein
MQPIIPNAKGPAPFPLFPNDPMRVIARALSDARGRGLDDVSQTRYAVATVLMVRPDLSAAEAALSVELVKSGEQLTQ